MDIYTSSCHCGRVQIRFLADLCEVVDCNCSYCRRKAALHHRITEDRFFLLSGEEALSKYKFGTMAATHYFCSICGAHTHCRPRSNPSQVNVNVRMIDTFNELRRELRIREYDGQAWAI